MTFPRAPFDASVETHPLLVVDWEKLHAQDPEALDVLWSAATKLGCACSALTTQFIQ
jgi:hypothetical protein